MQLKEEVSHGEGENIGEFISNGEAEDALLQEEGKGDKWATGRNKDMECVRKKTKKPSTNLPIGYRTAMTTGNPHNVMARVGISFDVDMGVSVCVKCKPLLQGDYISHYEL